MSNTVLFELGLEELPARFIDDAIEQLTKSTETWLNDRRIPYESVKSYSTPRRLAVQIFGVADKQPDLEEEAKGPAKKIALDENGEWSKAAIGFSKGQGQSVDEIYFKEIKGVEYVHVKKFTPGQSTVDLLADFKQVLLSLNFPKNMRWGSFNLKYARPIRWIAALFNDQVIPFAIENVSTDAFTYGHRFLGSKAVIEHADQYEQVLKNEQVIADKNKRKTMIEQQLSHLEQTRNWEIVKDDQLLNEITHLVEYPTVFSGEFSSEFLEVPEEALITSMKEHQRYFPVRSTQGVLQPFFVAVRNGNDKHLETVARGNEKVLKARLADAQFFYLEDQKGSIDEKLKKLERMVYQVELGTLADKVSRVKQFTESISRKLRLGERVEKQAVRAAEISKFDLVTHMVDEFSELQGIMGEKYARIYGEDEEVAAAINEHYMPRQANGQLPESTVGAVVSIADKLDTIVGSIAIGHTPTGSQDPYGLRRQSLGVIQILKGRNWSLCVEDLLDEVIDFYFTKNLPTRKKEDVVQDVHDFFRTRASYLLKDEGMAPDVIQSVLAQGIQVYSQTSAKALILMEKRNDNQFKSVHEALGRVLNLAKKTEAAAIDPALFENKSEAALYELHRDIHENYQQALQEQNPESALNLLAQLADPIHSFFDQTMVMAEDEQLRSNRLALLKQIASDILDFADLNAVQWKQQY
ncbi:glycine--tRNA ligase subunit beta [Halobacillus campisalis]|uniref:Glycine--tRNA ligase beta subunit n=1 Tax=Halobacillus campisalis TaxID=435909 RepID=A0ABW2K3Q8_9BACI|nr:glycine--tRNA ligase subunit beta [Halobacillus campisalis]